VLDKACVMRRWVSGWLIPMSLCCVSVSPASPSSYSASGEREGGPGRTAAVEVAARERFDPARVGEGLDALVERTLEVGHIVGAAVAIRHRGETLHARGYGFADRDAGIRATAETPFDIASVSKHFTAAVFVRWQQLGLLSLSDPLTSTRVDFPEVSIEQSLRHTSGLADYEEADVARWRTTGEALELEFAIDFAKRHARDFAPGERWRYNNTGFVAASLVAEDRLGKPFDELIRRDLLLPAGLGGIDVCHGARARPRIRGYDWVDGEHTTGNTIFDEPGIRGDGGLCASVADLVRAPEAFSALLGAEGMEMLLSPSSLSGGASVDYGLGTRLGTWRGRAQWGHTGGMTTYWAVLVHLPDEDLTIAVLQNTDGGDQDAFTLEGRVLAWLFGLDDAVTEFENGRYPFDRVREHPDGSQTTYHNGLFVRREWPAQRQTHVTGSPEPVAQSGLRAGNDRAARTAPNPPRR
jgi:D-alanyl-D-alanine carboxypeptidase